MLTPGAIVVRPTREDAEQDVNMFYLLLDTLREIADTLTLKQIAAITGEVTLNPQVNTHKKIKNRTLSKDARDFLLRFIFDQAALIYGGPATQVADIKDAFYFAFLKYAGVKLTSQDKSRARLIGTYRFWRPSVEHDGEYVFGKIELAESPVTRALTAKMVQIRRSGPGDPGEREEFSGYLFRVSHMHLLVLVDEITKDIRATILKYSKPSEIGTDLNPRSPFKGRLKHIIWMDGFVLGVDGDKVFFSPLHLSLVDDVDQLAALENTLDIIPESDPRLPPRVLRKLQRNGPLRRL
jgi:hypothetical protein